MKFRFWPKAWWLRVLLAGLSVVLLPYLLSRLASASRRVTINQLEGLKVDLEVRADQEATQNREFAQGFRIACYNIAHGRGLADSNWAGGGQQERRERLDLIAALLREVNAEVVVLNEVDFDASWSYGENQARYLAEKARYPYWVEQRNLDFRVLFWTWRFGNAVLSKHPIRNAKLLPLPAAAQWESWLAGMKQGVVCEIEIKGQPVQVIATHLEHRSEDARVASVNAVLEILKKSSFNHSALVGSRIDKNMDDKNMDDRNRDDRNMDDRNMDDRNMDDRNKDDEILLDKSTLGRSFFPTFLVGDLNSTPTHFPKSSADSQNENAMDLLERSGLFRHKPDQLPSEGDLTYRSDKPDRVIDWILIPSDWQFRNYVVHPSTLSDHRLIFSDVAR